nr:hypothetical protein [Anaerolineae bacterium]
MKSDHAVEEIAALEDEAKAYFLDLQTIADVKDHIAYLQASYKVLPIGDLAFAAMQVAEAKAVLQDLSVPDNHDHLSLQDLYEQELEAVRDLRLEEIVEYEAEGGCFDD